MKRIVAVVLLGSILAIHGMACNDSSSTVADTLSPDDVPVVDSGLDTTIDDDGYCGACADDGSPCIDSCTLDDGNTTEDTPERRDGDEADGGPDATTDAISCGPCPDDGNPCTIDECDPNDGTCGINAEDGTPVPDADLCNGIETCLDGVVNAGAPVSCADDGNPCTIDLCNPNDGSCGIPAEDGTLVPDPDLCNGIEACLDGVVNAGAPVSCTADDNPCTIDLCNPNDGSCGIPAEDGTLVPDPDLCNGIETCLDGVLTAGSPVSCTDDGNPCTIDQCNPDDGTCGIPAEDGKLVPDPDPCNGIETCLDGVITTGTPVSCTADDNPCTIDLCNPNDGSCGIPAEDGTLVPDPDLCNGIETCLDGVLTAGSPVSCTDDGNPCTIDQCNPDDGTCGIPAEDGTPVPDPDHCNGIETCLDGVVTAGSPVSCTDDGNPCTGDQCNPDDGTCGIPVEDGTPVPDADLCNGIETCLDGVVTAGSPVSCADDGNPCTIDQCNPDDGTCGIPVDDGTPVPDADPCNGIETCLDGVVNAGTPVSCSDDGNPCTIDLCHPDDGTCGISAEDGTLAPDPDHCNGIETCLDGVVTAGSPVSCTDDGNPCTVDQCNPDDGTCGIPVEDGTPVPDADLCNGIETCLDGVLTAGTPVSCTDDGNPCTIDLCNPDDGTCGVTIEDGTLVPDPDLCNGIETCLDGVVTAGSPVSCTDDGNPCTVDQCNPDDGTCGIPVEDGTPVPDTDPCNGIETCMDGVVTAGSPVSCTDDGNPCTVDQCNPDDGTCGFPVEDGTLVPDPDLCNGIETCLDGVVKAGTPVSCTDDSNPCTIDLCNPNDGICGIPVEYGTACDDGDSFTFDDHCDQGLCVPSDWDLDHDGWRSTVDCDDQDAAIHPGASETCDDRDNDCNGTPDDGPLCPSCQVCDGTLARCVVDSAMDGHECGTAGTCLDGVCIATCDCDDGIACTIDECGPDGSCRHSPSNRHCSPTGPCERAECRPESGGCVLVPFAPDVDGDGHADSLCGGDDCDDTRPEVHPLADEIHCNEIDENCDGVVPICSGNNLRLTSDSAASTRPSLATIPSPNGSADRIAVVWLDASTGGPEVMFTVVAADGSVVTPQVRLSNAGGTAEDPRIAADSAGTIVVAWVQSGGIRVLKIDPDGALLDSTTISQSGDIIRPDLTVSLDGSVHLVWEQYTVSLWKLYYALLDSGLNGSVKQITSEIWGISPKEPIVDLDDLGNAYLWWRDFRGSTYTTGMFVAKLTGGVVQFGGLECATSGDSPFAAATGTENSLIRGFRGSNQELYLVGASCQFVQLTEAAGASVDPAMACERRTADKRSVIVWSDDRAGSRDIHAMVYSYNGKLTNDVPIGVAPGDARHPEVVFDSNGTAWIAWQDARDGNWEIYLTAMDGVAGIHTCSDGEQIPVNLVCDGNADCSDEGDEAGCFPHCAGAPESYACPAYEWEVSKSSDWCAFPRDTNDYDHIGTCYRQVADPVGSPAQQCCYDQGLDNCTGSPDLAGPVEGILPFPNPLLGSTCNIDAAAACQHCKKDVLPFCHQHCAIERCGGSGIGCSLATTPSACAARPLCDWKYEQCGGTRGDGSPWQMPECDCGWIADVAEEIGLLGCQQAAGCEMADHDAICVDDQTLMSCEGGPWQFVDCNAYCVEGGYDYSAGCGFAVHVGYDTCLCEVARHIGETRTWWVYNSSTETLYETQATVIAESLNARLYLESGQGMSEERAREILHEFETGIYPSVRRYFGPEPNPGIDGSPQVMLVFLDIQDGWLPGSDRGFVLGYFSGINQLTEAEALTIGWHSNEAEVIFVDTYPLNVYSDQALSTIAHEFQHMVHWQARGSANESHKFVNEGMSMIAEDLCGFGPQYGRIQGLLESDHNDSLVVWSDELADYSTAYAFARYAVDQYDHEGSLLDLVMQNGQTGPECWDSALSSAAGTTFDLTFGNWVIATVFDGDGSVSPYGYTSVRMHDPAHSLNGITADGTNVNGPLAALEPRSFRTYYYSADSGSLTWDNGGPSVHVSLLAGKADGTTEIVANLSRGQAMTFTGRAWVIVANHSNSSSEAGGTVSYQGTGGGIPLALPARTAIPTETPPRGLCGMPMLPF